MRERFAFEREIASLGLRGAEPRIPTVERDVDIDRAARVNKWGAAGVGWLRSRGRILTLFGLPATADDRALADAVLGFQSKHPGLSQDGVLGADTWALVSTALDVDALSAAVKTAVLASVRSILQLLNRRLAASDWAGIERRQRELEAAFDAVPIPYAMRLYLRLESAPPGDRLASTFHLRLATPVRQALIVRLARRFFLEYELRYNTTGDTFSVDNNSRMSASAKAERKAQVQTLIGDLRSTPGVLWRRVLARQDAALAGGLPPPLPPQPKAVRDAVKAISDSQLDFFREWFPDFRGGIDEATFQHAFEQFANGELRDPSVPGHVALFEPNGGIFFAFAEFGFLAIELGFAAAEWTKILRTFVKMQEIFMHVYRERASSPPAVGAPLPTGSEQRDLVVVEDDGRGFHFANFEQLGAVGRGKGQSDLRRKIALRAKYDGMDLPRLQASARDNLRRALLMR